MKGRWFRQYDATMDDPKVQMLSDWHYRAWHTLLCFASKSGGEFTNDIDTLSFVLRKAPAKVRDTLQVLLSAKLFEPTENGFKPHNWDELQYKSDVSTERSKLHRQRRRNVAETAGATPPETEAETEAETDTETDSEKEKQLGFAAFAAAPPSPEFIRLPTNRFEKSQEEVIITEAQVAEFESLFRSVDVRQQLRSMRGWLISNTDGRKTRKGMMRFVNRWLSKQQDQGGGNGRAGQSGTQKTSGHDAFFAAAASFVRDEIGPAEECDDRGFTREVGRPLLPS